MVQRSPSSFALVFCRALTAAALAGCAPTVERARLRLDSSLAVDVSGTASIATLPNPTVLTDEETCLGTSIRHRVEGSRTYYSVQREGVSPSDFNDLKRCFVFGQWFGLDVERQDGWLATTYILTLKMFELPSEQHSEPAVSRWLPATMNVSMPGSSLKIEDASPRRVAEIGIDREGSAQADITLRLPPRVLRQAALEARNVCPGGGSNCPAAEEITQNGGWPAIVPVILKITSAEYKYGANELLALIALLFGSGLLFGAGRRMGARGEDPSRSDR
jgi:hypothetical protein